MGPPPPDPPGTFGSVTRLIGTRFSRHHDLAAEQVFHLAVAGIAEVVPGAVHAGVTVRERSGRLRSAVLGTEVVARLEQAQAALREGPALDVAGGREVWADDLAPDAVAGGRWPRWASEALAGGVRGVLALPIGGPAPRRGPVPVLSLYARAEGAFDDGARMVARLYAEQAALALVRAERALALGLEQERRTLIEQAKGVLMQRHRVRAPEAFDLLVGVAAARGLRLEVAAAALVAEVTDP